MTATDSKPDSDSFGAVTPVSADRAASEVRLGERSRGLGGRPSRGRAGGNDRGGDRGGAPADGAREETGAEAVLRRALAAAEEISSVPVKEATQTAIEALGDAEEDGYGSRREGGEKGGEKENGGGAHEEDGPRDDAPVGLDGQAGRGQDAASSSDRHQGHISFHHSVGSGVLPSPGGAAQAPSPARRSPRLGVRPPGILRSRESSLTDLASPDALVHEGRDGCGGGGGGSAHPSSLPRIPSHGHVSLAVPPPPSAVFPVLAAPPLSSTPSMGGVAFFSSPAVPPSLGGSRNPSLDGLCLRGGSRSSRDASVDALARVTRDELRDRAKRESSLLREARRRLSESRDGSHDDGNVPGDDGEQAAPDGASRGRRPHGRHRGRHHGSHHDFEPYASSGLGPSELGPPYEHLLRRTSASFADLDEGRSRDRAASLSIEPDEGIPGDGVGSRRAPSGGPLAEDLELDAALDSLRHPSLLPPGHAHLYPAGVRQAPSLSFSYANGRSPHVGSGPLDEYAYPADRAPPPSRHMSPSGSQAHLPAGHGFGSHEHLASQEQAYSEHGRFPVQVCGSQAHLAAQGYGSRAHLAAPGYGSQGHVSGLDGEGYGAHGSSSALHASSHHAGFDLSRRPRDRGSQRSLAMARSRSHPHLFGPRGGSAGNVSARRAPAVGPADEDLLSALLRGPAPAASGSAARGAASGDAGPVTAGPASASVSSAEPESPPALPPLPLTLPQRLLKGAYEVLETVVSLPALRSPVAPLVLGYLFTYYNGKTTEERKAQIERANGQVRLLYGPLFAITSATRSAYAAMVRQHSPDGTVAGFVHAVRSDPTSTEAMAYRRWMLDVIQPLNDRAVEVIVAHTDLLEEPSLDDQLLHFVAHASAWKVITARWRAGDLSEWSAITYPNQLPDMVERAFQRIKAKQARLLGESGGYAGGRALRNVGRLGAWLWDGARWATGGSSGRGLGVRGGVDGYDDEEDDDDGDDDDGGGAGAGAGGRDRSVAERFPLTGTSGGKGGSRTSHGGRGGYGRIVHGYGAPRLPRRTPRASNDASAPSASSGGYDPKTGYDGRNGPPGLAPAAPTPYTPPASSERAGLVADGSSSPQREAGSGVDLAPKRAAWGGAKRSPQIASSEKLQPRLNEVRARKASPSIFLKAAEEGIRKVQGGGARAKL